MGRVKCSGDTTSKHRARAGPQTIDKDIEVGLSPHQRPKQSPDRVRPQWSRYATFATLPFQQARHSWQ
jgi:hypothetical protein